MANSIRNACSKGWDVAAGPQRPTAKETRKSKGTASLQMQSAGPFYFFVITFWKEQNILFDQNLTEGPKGIRQTHKKDTIRTSNYVLEEDDEEEKTKSDKKDEVEKKKVDFMIFL